MSKFDAFARYWRVGGPTAVRAALIGKCRGGWRPVRVAVPKARTTVTLRAPSSDFDVFEQVFVREDYKLGESWSPEVIIDAGANIGLTSVYLAERFPKARIIAIEPEAENFEQLERNTQAYPKIECVCAALWGEDTRLAVVDVGLGAWGFMTKEADGSGGPTIRAMGVETLLKRLGIERVCLFKIDIEGAERQLFADPGASWVGQVDAFMVELHDRLEPGCTAAFEMATKDFPVAWHQGELTCRARALASCGKRVGVPSLASTRGQG